MFKSVRKMEEDLQVLKKNQRDCQGRIESLAKKVSKMKEENKVRLLLRSERRWMEGGIDWLTSDSGRTFRRRRRSCTIRERNW